MSAMSDKARAASYFEKKFDRRKHCDLYLMCGEDAELMDEVVEELAEEFRAHAHAAVATYLELLLRSLSALVRDEVISASRAREVAGVSAEYWREFVRSAPAIDGQASGYVEVLPERTR